MRSRAWPAPRRTLHIRQAYLNQRDELSVRVRNIENDYWLTLKAGVRSGVRHEFEWPIPAEDGRVMIERLASAPPITKVRHEVEDAGRLWEVDVFDGANAGLVIAETELHDLHEPLVLPAWLGPEVTGDPRLSNNALYRHPFTAWGISYEQLLAEAAR